MRRYGELSRGAERSSPRQFSPDCTIAMRGYDFREGQGCLAHGSRGNQKQMAPCIGAICEIRSGIQELALLFTDVLGAGVCLMTTFLFFW